MNLSKKYQKYAKYILIHVHAWNTCITHSAFKSEFVWNVHIKVMLKVIEVIDFSVLNICELTTTINCEIPRLTEMYIFSDQMN